MKSKWGNKTQAQCYIRAGEIKWRRETGTIRWRGLNYLRRRKLNNAGKTCKLPGEIRIYAGKNKVFAGETYKMPAKKFRQEYYTIAGTKWDFAGDNYTFAGIIIKRREKTPGIVHFLVVQGEK